MPIDNTLYDRLAETWWDENKVLNILRTWVNPARFGYSREVLERLKVDPRGKETLDVGCGGGLLAEEFARLGCRVTGIDPSELSIATARVHAQRQGLAIDYQVGFGEDLPFADESFDIVYCCDVLEHVSNLEAVTVEIARVLKPGGIFFYDTINRTWISNLITIKLLQEWKATRVMPPNIHDWQMFIKPRELLGVMRRRALVPQEMVGMGPHANLADFIELIYTRIRGEFSFKDAGTKIKMGKVRNKWNLYMGYALKASNSV
jgi:2-polyprenyl-6-hydroxyphenyl methylase / 3-demethylubiquinone-9 3-methyltransferase